MSRYIVDGNALFLTTTETAWRRASASHFAGGGLVIAIGYPIHGKLYDGKRRSVDMTSPTRELISGYGKADVFLDFIEKFVRPAVKTRFPHTTITREALYGHSYGGLLALNALFTRPSSFDCYMASSPSIWWNDRCILEEAKNFMANKRSFGQVSPSLMVFWGSLESNPHRWDDETLDHYESRKQMASDLRMADNAIELCRMLEGCEQLHSCLAHEYDGEKHTSAMACSVGRSLTMFFEDWPFHVCAR